MGLGPHGPAWARASWELNCCSWEMRICILRNMYLYLRLYRRAPEPTESRCQADEARGALVGSDLDNLAASRHFQLGGSPTKRLKIKRWLVGMTLEIDGIVATSQQHLEKLGASEEDGALLHRDGRSRWRVEAA